MKREANINMVCQNGDLKVNEEILCLFGYLFKINALLDWVDLQ